MALCERCAEQLPQPDTFAQGDLVIERSPPSASWAGRLICTSPTRVRILRTLAQRGRFSHEGLLCIPTQSARPLAMMQVQVTLLRREMERVDAGIEIRSIWGWGYELIWKPNP